MAENSGDGAFIELTATIVSAYVSNNSVPSAEIPNLIGQIYSALKRVSGGQTHRGGGATQNPPCRSSAR